MKISYPAVAIVTAASSCGPTRAFVPAFRTTQPIQRNANFPSLSVATKTDNSAWIETFELLDADQSGFIDKSELKSALIALGQPSSDKDIASLLEAEGISSGNDDIQIDRSSFFRIVGADDDNLELKRSEVLQMFHSIDIDASGYLTAAELQHFLGSFGTFLSDEKVSQFLRLYDDDGNGRITFEEFEGIVVDLGFKVEKDTPLATSYVENVLVADKTGDDIDPIKQTEDEDPQVHAAKKLFDLSSLANAELKEALAPFDVEGDGTIDLIKVREVAEGKAPSKLHWSEKRQMVGLAGQITSVNHIALLVSDVSKSLRFYINVMGFEQIRRPNFDAHGAWLTMGNCELHLIKGTPAVPEGDDHLVVGHISLDAKNVGDVLEKLQSMNVPFRKNSSVPAGADTGSMNTNANDDMMSSEIVTQFFIRDPDGYYLEVCNCDDTLTKYCLGEKTELAGYQEGVEPLSFAAASATISLIQRWLAKLEAHDVGMNDISAKATKTDGSIQQIAKLLDCQLALAVDEETAQTLKDRHSIWGDVWQNEELGDIGEILLEAGNDPKKAEQIAKFRQQFRGYSIYRPPVVFNPDGTKTVPEPIIKPIKKD